MTIVATGPGGQGPLTTVTVFAWIWGTTTENAKAMSRTITYPTCTAQMPQ